MQRNKLEKNTVLMIFFDFKILTRRLKKGSLAKKYEKYENYSGRFPEGVQKEEIQQ